MIINKNIIKKNEKIEKGKKIIKILQKNGFEAFLVGGAVRDFFLDIPFYDVDITTNAKVEEVKNIFECQLIESNSIKFGSIKVFFENNLFEITSYRKEGPYLNYRYPSYVIFISDIKKDILRRDFTINGLLMNEKSELIDFIGGYHDLIEKKIQTIGDPYVKLTEDVVRMIRIFYLQAKLNFEIEFNTKRILKENIYLLKKIHNNRMIKELKKVFSQKYLEKTFISLKETNAIFFLKKFSNYFPILLENFN
ncbi:poly A polymerase head domain protein [Candidatus Phytoplasma oryzae]|uniref:Poly A polymerase head domain protein n=1 Tax=Candidatus Phytoplasma oryzae TaxID=203274 RepID=A0A139JQH3_9MOLU|nr:hypothetical protein [Candidatus Phytoplasma oryzae]KXT29110.1 poly A polymerase head domain protein [Candidatus Phytoplasma oryzae]RAM57818.1 hypothetical protein DH96_01845 [Candidatus Phytoplasma oryzae]